MWPNAGPDFPMRPSVYDKPHADNSSNKCGLQVSAGFAAKFCMNYSGHRTLLSALLKPRKATRHS